MRQTLYSRRETLKLGGAVGVGIATGLAGCTDSDGGDGSTPRELEMVPAEATMVARIEVATLLSDPMVETAVEDALAAVPAQQPGTDLPKNYDGALSLAEGELGLDPRDVDVLTVVLGSLGSQTDSEITGVVIETELAESDVVESVKSELGGSFSERTYEGSTLYEPEQGSGAMGVVDGRYVLGTVGLCESVADVSAGNTDPVSGDVAAAYERAPSGPIRVGTAVTSDSAGPVSSVETVAGGMAVDGDQRRMVVEVETSDADDAGKIQTMLETGLSELQDQADGESMEPFAEGIEQLDAIEVEQDGTTVSATYSASAEEAGAFGVLVAAAVASFVLELGESPGTAPPRAAFDLDYDGVGDGSVTITHQSGDMIEGSTLYVRGDTGNGPIDTSWADHGVTEVMAGSSITIQDVTGSFDLDIVWVAEDQSTSATLASFRGPDA